MTDTAAATEYEFTVPDKRAKDTPRMTFTVNGEPFVILMPKLTIAVQLLSVLEREDNLTRVEYGIELARAMWGLIDYVQKEPPELAVIPNPDWTEASSASVPAEITNPNGGRPRGRARLMQRLQDPEDGLDVDHLAPVLGRMMSVMFNRPTKSPDESQPKPSGDGADSAAATPPAPAETS